MRNSRPISRAAQNPDKIPSVSLRRRDRLPKTAQVPSLSKPGCEINKTAVIESRSWPDYSLKIQSDISIHFNGIYTTELLMAKRASEPKAPKAAPAPAA